MTLEFQSEFVPRACREESCLETGAFHDPAAGGGGRTRATTTSSPWISPRNAVNAPATAAGRVGRAVALHATDAGEQPSMHLDVVVERRRAVIRGAIGRLDGPAGRSERREFGRDRAG